MAHDEQGPGGRSRDPQLAAALEDLKPYVAAAAAVSLLGAPAELGVPLVRRLRRRSGVSLAPGLMTLVNGTVALAAVHFFRRHPDRWQRWKQARIARWAGSAALAHATLSPAAAAVWKPAVVLRGRSPLWGGLVTPIGQLQIAMLLVALHRARRARLRGSTGASEDRVEPTRAAQGRTAPREGTVPESIEETGPRTAP